MKICLINNLYQPYQRGGAENIVQIISRGLIEAGQQVVIITTKPRGELRITNYELRVYYLNSFYYNLNKLPKFLRLFWQIWNTLNLVSYFSIKKILLAEKCDAVITNNLMGVGFLTPLAIRSLKIKHCHYLHDIQLIHPSGLIYCGQEKRVRSLGARAYARLCRWLFASPEIVISPSNWLLDFHQGRGFFPLAKKIVLPNPVAELAFKPSGQKNNNIFTPLNPVRNLLLNGTGDTDLTGFNFLFVGQIEQHKGIIFLVKAFIKFLDIVKQKTELIIIGAGAKMPEVEKMIAKNNKIKLLGKVSPATVFEQMAAADCLIVPSLCYENSPSVIYQARQSGLPIIAANIGGIKELLRDSQLMLFAPGSQEELINKMSWAMANPAELKKISQAGLIKAKEYNLDNYLKKLLAIIST